MANAASALGAVALDERFEDPGRRHGQVGHAWTPVAAVDRVGHRGQGRNDADLAHPTDPVGVVAGLGTSTTTVSIMGRSEATGMR